MPIGIRSGQLECGTEEPAAFRVPDECSSAANVLMHSTDGKSNDAAPDTLEATWESLDWNSLRVAGGPSGWLRDIGIQYRPMWDCKRRAISTFLAIPTRRLAGQAVVTAGRQNVLSDGNPAAHGQLDTFMLQEAGHHLADTLEEGARALVSVQVGYETMASATTRMEYMRHWPQLSEETRKHLILEVIGLPDGIAASRLFELAGMIKRQCRAVIAQVPPGYQAFSLLRDSGISVAGIEIVSRPADETALVARLQRFAENAGKAGLSTYLHGALSLSLTVAAVAAGFTYIAGNTVASPGDGLQLVRRFGLDDLYMRMLRRPE